MGNATHRTRRSPFAEAGKWIVYGLLSRVFHHPELLRALCTPLRFLRLPFAAAPVARYRTLVALFRRQNSFSNTSHAPNMPANRNFLIGMDAGPAQERARARLMRSLPSESDCAAASGTESRTIIERLRASPTREFNLIDDYMATVVWSALRQVFGSAAASVEAGDGKSTPSPQCPLKNLFLEVRYLGAHLIVGGTAPRRIALRAKRAARRLNARVGANVASIQAAARARATAHGGPAPPPAALAVDNPKSVQRDAVGLMWVGHPATVQAGALIMQDLMGRPEIYRSLRTQAQSIGDGVWTDEAFRAQLKAHVLESLRFRPPFPLLTRDVPRATAFDAGGRGVEAKAGNPVTLLTIGAMFDRDALVEPDRYSPGRPDSAWSDLENRELMFGYGPRSCIAKHHVVEILISALAGLLTLPQLRYADPWWRRIGYDGPIIVRMRLSSKNAAPKPGQEKH